MTTLDTSALGAMLRERRGALSMRKAADEAGVSVSTYSRVESGAQPDLASFTNLCNWLKTPPAVFFTDGTARQPDPVDIAVSHLQADPRLSPENASKIGSILRDMYDALADPAVGAPQVMACHLRAASTLRPGVAQRLSRVLEAINEELLARDAEGSL